MKSGEKAARRTGLVMHELRRDAQPGHYVQFCFASITPESMVSPVRETVWKYN
jgi:hypothetical protein